MAVLVLVIIDNFDRIALSFTPNETDPPLVVDPDTVLACPPASQRLQAICGRNTQVIQALGSVEDPQLPAGKRLDLIRQATRHVAIPYPFGLLVSEGPDHERL
jgi:hypothetical protein